MNWFQRLTCKHPVLISRTWRKYVPNNLGCSMQCERCGRTKVVMLGPIGVHSGPEALITKLSARGYKPDGGLSFRRNA